MTDSPPVRFPRERPQTQAGRALRSCAEAIDRIGKAGNGPDARQQVLQVAQLLLDLAAALETAALEGEPDGN